MDGELLMRRLAPLYMWRWCWFFSGYSGLLNAKKKSWRATGFNVTLNLCCLSIHPTVCLSVGQCSVCMSFGPSVRHSMLLSFSFNYLPWFILISDENQEIKVTVQFQDEVWSSALTIQESKVYRDLVRKIQQNVSRSLEQTFVVAW